MTGQARQRRSQAGVLAILTGCWVLLTVLFAPSPASAAGANDLLSCNSLVQAIEREDGSIVALGHSRPCSDSLRPASPGRWQVLVGLEADGRLNRDFGEGGYALDNLNERENMGGIVAMADGGLLVYNPRRIRSYSADGSPDPDFGVSGQLDPAGPDTSRISDVVASADGGFLIAGSESGPATVARYNRQGELETGFGTGGIAETGVPYPSILALDSSGRILVAGISKMVRLSSDGTLDPGFGDSGYTDLESWELLYGLSVGDDGQIKLITGRQHMYSTTGFLLTFDADGQPTGSNPPDAFGSVNSAVTVAGGAAWAADAGRMDDPRFSVGFPGSIYPRSYLLSPGFAVAHGITELGDGNVLAVGYSRYSDQRKGSMMALAKLDPLTGAPVRSFGANGTRLLPANRCVRGSKGHIGDWSLCKVRRPRVTGKVKLGGRFAKRPVLAVRASLGTPPTRLWGTMQHLAVTLPRGMKIRSGARRKIRVSTHPYTPVKVWFRKRKVHVMAQPDYEAWRGIYWGVKPPPDRAINFRLKLRRGALAPLTRKARKKALRFRLAGAFLPVRGGMTGDLTQVWFASNRSATGIRIPRPGR